MIKDFLVRITIGEELDPNNPSHRTRLGIGVGILGIVLNLLVTLAKLVIGLIVGSMAIVSDGFNNLTDAFSSIVTSVGMFLAGSPPDEEHPHGHGRLEYLIALVIAVVILFVGGLLLYNSIDNILNPEPVEFTWPAVVVVLISIIIKYIMYIFYKDIGEEINSAPLKAASLDSIGDTGVTMVVLIAYILSNFTDFPFDGVGSFIVSLLIIKSGIDMILEMVSELVSEEVDPNLQGKVEDHFNREGILGTHDFNIHKYGPGVTYATIDAVVDPDLDLRTIDQIFTEIQYEIYHDLAIEITIQMDVKEENPTDIRLRELIENQIRKKDYLVSYHDEFIDNQALNIGFHLVLDSDKVKNNREAEQIKKDVAYYIYGYFPGYNITIIIDRDF